MYEDFKSVNDYPNYIVSFYGEVVNIKTNKVLSYHVSNNGYSRVQLSRDGKGKCFFVHRLVAVAFVENKNSKPYVNHIDGCKTNNNASNLEWVTSKENTIHAQDNNLKNDSKPIFSVNFVTEEILKFNSISECSRALSINKGSIHRVLSGKRNRVGNYRFEYVRK